MRVSCWKSKKSASPYLSTDHPYSSNRGLMWVASALCIRCEVTRADSMASRNGRSALGDCLPHGGLLMTKSVESRLIKSAPKVAWVTSIDSVNPNLSTLVGPPHRRLDLHQSELLYSPLVTWRPSPVSHYLTPNQELNILLSSLQSWKCQ